MWFVFNAKTYITFNVYEFDNLYEFDRFYEFNDGYMCLVVLVDLVGAHDDVDDFCNELVKDLGLDLGNESGLVDVSTTQSGPSSPGAMGAPPPMAP